MVHTTDVFGFNVFINVKTGMSGAAMDNPVSSINVKVSPTILENN